MALFLVTRIQQGIIPSNPRNNPLNPPIQHDIISSNQKIISSPRPFNRALFYLSLFFSFNLYTKNHNLQIFLLLSVKISYLIISRCRTPTWCLYAWRGLLLLIRSHGLLCTNTIYYVIFHLFVLVKF